MQSARVQQLQAQRNKYAGFKQFSGKRRISPPGSLASAVSGIAKKTVEADLKDKMAQYNDGVIGNSQMLEFLNGLLGNTLLSASEKVDVQNAVRDFNDKVQTESLKATYDNSEKGTPERAQAAQAIADYYSSKSQSLQPDTPAYSDALQKAGTWKASADSETTAVLKSQRQLKRAQLFKAVTSTVPGSADEAQQKAQAFSELAQQARTDGNETEALQFETQAQDSLNKIPAIQEGETKKMTQLERKSIVDSINQLSNDYHDGKITADQFAQAIPALEGRAVGIGDTSIQLALNKWSDSLAKDVAKGVQRGTFNGLPVVLKRGGGTGGGAVTNWDKENFDYSDSLRKLKTAYDKGKIDGTAYMTNISKVVVTHAQELSTQIQNIEAVAQQNPDAKVYYNGKKQRAADVLENLYNEYDSIDAQAGAIKDGKAAFVMVGPSQFTQSGTVARNGKGVPQLQIIDTRNMPQGQYMKDNEGIYHQIKAHSLQLNDAIKQGLLTPEQANMAMQMGSYYDDNGTIHKVTKDSSGNYHYETGKQYVRVYDNNSPAYKDVILNGGEKDIASFAKMTQAEQAAKIKQQASAQQQQNAPKLQAGQNILDYNKENFMPQPSIIDKAKEFGTKLLQGVTKPESIAAPKAANPVVSQPAVVPAEQLKIPAKVSMPTAPIQQAKSIASAPTTGAAQISPINMPSPDKLQVVGAPQPNALQKMAQQPGFKPAPIQGLQGLPVIPKAAPTPLSNAFSAAGNFIKGLATKILPAKKK